MQVQLLLVVNGALTKGRTLEVAIQLTINTSIWAESDYD